MTDQAPEVNAEICVSRIFEIVQSMSGQGNVITIPCPYLDFFAGDQQAHLLGAILNQLVFWSGKSDLTDGWFYKSYEGIAEEIRAVTKDQVRKAMNKLVEHYFPGIIEVSTKKVNGTPIKHYRIDGDALIGRIFPPLLETAELPHGNGNIATSETAELPHGNGSIATSMETAELPHGNGNIATSFLYTDIKDLNTKDLNTSPGISSPDKKLSTGEEKKSSSDQPKGKWGTPEDHQCAEWIFSRIKKLYEKAAETDGEVTRPKDPNWNAWANEIRLMRTIDRRTHRQICEMFKRVQGDSFWCKNVLSPSKLREKWDELSLKLSPANGVIDSDFDDEYYENDRESAVRLGFRVS